MTICALCSQPFEITEADHAFYRKIEVPPPTLCPKDRLKRRLSFRNERNLFKRKCDKTGKDIISNFRADVPFPVYEVEEWHKDDWTPPMLASYDFSKGFFEQFAELMKIAPHMHKASGGNEINSPYTNHAGNCKNCYFMFNSEYDEDCMYMRFGDHCRDCVDVTNILDSELCYECVNVEKCYDLRHSDDCKNCTSSAFLRYCRGVTNSLFCYGLEHKEYHVFNQPVGKEEFERIKKELALDTYTGFQSAVKRWEEWSAQFPRRRQVIQNCENVTGDALYNSKNAFDCYNCTNLHDCRYVLNSAKVKDSYDFYAYGETELSYECVTAFKVYNAAFCSYIIQCDYMEYSDYCWGCHYCFGCSGLKGKSYCIFNKQYTKEEYFDLVARIKAQMKERGEYGEFFPISLSPFPYEDTLAQDYFPQQEKVTSVAQGSYLSTKTLPDESRDIDAESLSKNTYLCPQTHKLFRFQKMELEYYKKQGIPVPHVSFEARYRKRNELVAFPY